MLDGSSIRAAREAKGLTQAELADRIGVAQQTIEKIETGKVKRTSYLPEIDRALSIEKMENNRDALSAQEAAEQALKIALAAGAHTPAQIISALSAAGLTITKSRLTSGAEFALDRSDPWRYIASVAKRHGITNTELARKVGVSPSTINKPLANPDTTAFPAMGTLRKIMEWDRCQN